jgi:DNA polymerase-3 subunit gamma/tau
VEHVLAIAKVEGIKFENIGLVHQLATLGRGSVRDTLSLLDQVLTTSLDDNITEKNLTNSLGVAGPSSLNKILKFLYGGDTLGLSNLYNKLLDENVPVKNIASGLLDEIFKELKTNKDIGEAEIIWIYETIARETSWIFSSIAPEKAFEVLLYKVALRRSFFSMKIPANEHAPATVAEVLEKNFSDLALEADKISILTPLKENEIKPQAIAVLPSQIKEISWEGFLNYLNKKAPASASNLEQGNITSPLRLENGELSIELGFGYSGLVFMDYLSEPEVFQKLIHNLSEYFEVEKNKIKLQLLSVQSTEKFISTAEIKEQLAEISTQERVEDFKNNPLLKEAEKIFNAKIDKVIIDNAKK